MAIGHVAIRSHSRAKGHAAALALAYRHGARVVCPRTGIIGDYTRRNDVVDRGIVSAVKTPIANSLDALAGAVESAEKRRDAALGRDVQVAIPHELPIAAQRALIVKFAGWLTQQYQTVVSWAIHGLPVDNEDDSSREHDGDIRNVHAHLWMPTRALTPSGAFGRKLTELRDLPQSRAEVTAIREEWASIANEALREHEIDAVVDVGRRLDCDPAPTLGQARTSIERKAARARGVETVGVPVAEVVRGDRAVTGTGRRLAAHGSRRRRRRRRRFERAAALENFGPVFEERRAEPTPVPTPTVLSAPNTLLERRVATPERVDAPEPLRVPRALLERRVVTPIGVSAPETLRLPSTLLERRVVIPNRVDAPGLLRIPGTPLERQIVTPEEIVVPRPLRAPDTLVHRKVRPAPVPKPVRLNPQLAQRLRFLRERLAFLGGGFWPDKQRMATAVWASTVHAGEPYPGLDIKPVATHFLTPADSVRLLKETAVSDINSTQAELREMVQEGQNRRTVSTRFVADMCWFDPAAASSGRMRVHMRAWTQRHVARLPAWAQERIVERCREWRLPEDTVTTVRIPMGLVTNVVVENTLVPEADCVAFMRRPDELGRLPKFQHVPGVQPPPGAPTLDELFATDAMEVDRAAALRQATFAVVIERLLLPEGGVFELPAIEVDWMASHALGVSSLVQSEQRGPAPERARCELGVVREEDGGRGALYPCVEVPSQWILRNIELLVCARPQAERARSAPSQPEPTAAEVQTVCADLDARLPQVLTNIGQKWLSVDGFDTWYWDEFILDRRAWIERELREEDSRNPPFIRSPESEEIAVGMLDEQLRLLVLEQFGDERPPRPPFQSIDSEATRHWQKVIGRGFAAWKELGPQIARGVRNAIARLEIFSGREQDRRAQVSRPQRSRSGSRGGWERG